MKNINEIFNHDDFRKLDFNKQQKMMLNFFDKELADDGFRALPEKRQQEIKSNFLIKELNNIGAIKPTEDGAGFMTRSKFGFADTDSERKQVLEDEYGKGNTLKLGDRWVYRDKKGFHYVDEDGLSWKDTTADILGELPEIIGTTGGALIGGGTTFGTGTVAGASIGAGAGRSVKDLLKDVLGVNDREDKRGFLDKLLSKSANVAESAGYGGLSEVGGKVIGDVGKKYIIDPIFKPFTNSIRPDADIIKSIAKKNNINLLPSDLVQSKGMARLENLLNQGFAGQPIAKAKDEQFTTLQKELNKYLDSLGTKKTDTELGREIVETIQNNRNVKNNYLSGEYDKLGKAIEDLANYKKSNNLSDIPWDKLSQKEASKMYSVLNNGKNSTSVKTNVGDVEVNNNFADKMHNTHLDNPNLRGMTTTEETISFPKVAKNIEPTSGYQGNTWNANANDGSNIVYGSRDWGDGEKLLTVHSKTGNNQRGQYASNVSPSNINDTVSIKPSNENIISNSNNKSQVFLPMDETLRAIDDIAKGYEWVGTKSTPESVSIGKAISDKIGTIGGYPEYNGFKNQRSALINDISKAKVSGDKNLERELTTIKKAMDKDLDVRLMDSGLGEQKKALDKEFTSFKSVFDNPNSIVGKTLKNDAKNGMDYSTVGGKVIDNVSDMERVRKALNNDDTLIKQAYTNNLRDKSIVYNSGQEIPYNGYISTNKLNTEIGKNSESFANAFNQNEQQKINDFINLGKTINYTKNVEGNPSGTGKVVDGLASLGLFALDPATAGVVTGGRYLGAKAYTSDIGKKYLTDGFDVGNGAVAQTLFGSPARRTGFYEAFKNLDPFYLNNQENKK